MSGSIAPDLPDALAVRLRIALILHEAGAGVSAGHALRNLLVDAYNARGIALAGNGHLMAALTCFEAAVEINPRHATVLSNRANTLHMLGRTDAALASNDQALLTDPQHVDALFNRGLILYELGRIEEGLGCLDRVLTLHPDHGPALGNRGTMLNALGRLEEAIPCFQRAQMLLPDDPTLRVNEALARLALGDYAQGWKQYESRWGTALHPIKRSFGVPQWRGEDVPADCTILLHAEQGFGDTLQFCRYVPLVARRARVVLEVSAPLRRLMATLSDDIEVITEGNKLPAFDLHCPLLSLPFAFGTTLESIPADVPYLRADRRLAPSWRKELAALAGVKIGLVWAGDSGRNLIETRARDRRRSIPLGEFAPLGALSQINLISLQKGPAATEAAQPPPGLTIHDWTNGLTDFADTAALIAGLDLVISVDTAVAHLAGALGKPVWVLNRHDACWRWLLNRTDSPWYPTARLFRQPTSGDWGTVIAEVTAALADFSPRPLKRQARRRKVQ